MQDDRVRELHSGVLSGGNRLPAVPHRLCDLPQSNLLQILQRWLLLIDRQSDSVMLNVLLGLFRL